MNGTNWFNAAAGGQGGGVNLGASSSSLFGQPAPGSTNDQRGLFGNNGINGNNAGTSNVFGGNQLGSSGMPSSPSASQQSFFTGRDRENIPQSDLAESQTLQSRYLESFTPGNKKKTSAAKTSASPTGPMSFTEPSRFGSNSLYGSGAGVSPSKTPHRLARPPMTHSTSSPMGNSSVRSRMSTGGSGGSVSGEERGARMGVDEDRPPVESYADLEGMGRAEEMNGGAKGMEQDDGMRTDDDDGDDGPANLLMVYGLGPSKQDRLQSLLSSYGTLTQFHIGPSDSNYVVVAFDDPAVGPRLQRQSGELRLDGCYLGVKKVDEGTWSGVNGGQSQQQRTGGPVERRARQDEQHQTSSTQSRPNALSRPDSNDPFASISTLTPIKSGSVFRPSTPAVNGQQQQVAIPSQYAFGTGSQAPTQTRSGLFGRISDVMFGQ